MKELTATTTAKQSENKYTLEMVLPCYTATRTKILTGTHAFAAVSILASSKRSNRPPKALVGPSDTYPTCIPKPVAAVTDHYPSYPLPHTHATINSDPALHYQ